MSDIEALIRSAIPDEFILDPPDGGDVKTVEGVQRMADLITALRDENEKLTKRVEWFTHAIHTCHDECDRPLCKTTRERDALRAELERKDAALEAWNSAVRVDVLMEGPRYMGVEPSRGRQAWELTRAALSAQKEEEA